MFHADTSLEKRGEILAPSESLGNTPVIPLLAPWPVNKRKVFAHPPKIEDRVDKHVCHRHQRAGIINLEQQASVETQALVDFCP